MGFMGPRLGLQGPPWDTMTHGPPWKSLGVWMPGLTSDAWPRRRMPGLTSNACGIARCLWRSRMPVTQWDACGTVGCLDWHRMRVKQSDVWTGIGCPWHSRMPVTHLDACDITRFLRHCFVHLCVVLGGTQRPNGGIRMCLGDFETK